jgi:signal transduction histidine kinase
MSQRAAKSVLPIMTFVVFGEIAVLILAAFSAWRTIGQPSATLLIDPFGSYSNVALSGWPPSTDGLHLKLHFPIRLQSVDGVEVGPGTHYDDLPAHRVRQLLQQRWEQGGRTVRLRFGDEPGAIEVKVPLTRITAAQIWPLFTVYAAMALCMGACGLLVFVLARHHPGGRAYLLLAASGFLFLATFVDYHSRASLTPLFMLGYCGTDVALVWLAFSFPSLPAHLLKFLRPWHPLAVAIAVGDIAWTVCAPFFGSDAMTPRIVMSVGISISLLLLATSMIVRFFWGKREERGVIQSALWGLGAVPVIIAVATTTTLLTSARILQTFIPLGGFFIPLAVGYALIKHNVFDTRVVMTRRLVRITVLLLTIGMVAVGWQALDALPGAATRILIPTLAITGLLVATFVVLSRLADRFLFGAARLFQPTIEQLSDHLAHLRQPGEISAVIEELTRQCVPVQSSRVVLPADFRDLAGLSLERLQHGERYWIGGIEKRRLLFPMRSLGELRAVLAVDTIPGVPPFSSADMALIEAVASVGAVSLHNADVVCELDELRRLDQAVSSEGKRLAIGTLAAEVSHEIAYSLNYFRFMLRQVGSGKPPASDEVEIGHEEIERLERMLASLRRLRSPSPVSKPVPLLATVRRALGLLKEILAERRLQCSLDIAPEQVVQADPDAILQVFANLLRNGARAVAEGGQIGVRAYPRKDGYVIDVWDNGPGVPEHLKEAIFSPWVTTRKDGSGLGLAVSLRIARAHGWDLDLHREEDRTVFRIIVPGGSAPTNLVTVD